jgi:PPE-repeat protein
MDYGLMPPEINSERMYSGPGSASLLAAATAWGRVAEGLDEAADGFRSVTTKLNSGWQGTAAIAMTQAAAPYLGWLNAAAAKGEQTAAHARAAATAYDEAHAGIVPPPVIAANRSRRMSMGTNNPLGQDTPSLAAMDADYEQMWARNVETMYTYAAASADASKVTPFTSAPLGAVDDPEVISAGSQLISTLPQALQALSSSPLTAFEVVLASVASSVTKLNALAIPVKFPMGLLNFLGKGRRSAGRATVQARWGGGMRIGRLSVPPAWGMLEPPSPVSVNLPCSVRRIRLIGGRAVSGRLVYS